MFELLNDKYSCQKLYTSLAMLYKQLDNSVMSRKSYRI